MSDEQRKVHELLETYDNVMLVTQREEGRLDARPMHVARLDSNCDMWFLTRTDEKVDELTANPIALVVAQNEKTSWLSVTGRVEVMHDRARVEELWQEPYRAWFPGGKDDPELRILAFRAEQGEYWDQRGAKKIVYALKVARAYVSGDAPRPDSGEHGTERL
jgi:general stress protein 26